MKIQKTTVMFLLWKSRRLFKKYFRIFRTVFFAVLFCIIWWEISKQKIAELESFEYFFWIDLWLILGTIFIPKIPEALKRYFSDVFIAAGPALCLWGIEYLHGNSLKEMKFLFVFLNYFLMLTVFLILQFLFNRLWITIAVGMSSFTFYGVLYSFVKEFRGNGLRAADIYAAETAMNVADGYVFEFTEKRVLVILGAVTFFLLSLYVSYKQKRRERLKPGVLSVCFIFIINSLISNEKFMEENSVKPYLWELSTSEKDHGAFLDFAAGLPYLKVEKPEGYSKEEALALEEKRAEGNSNLLEVKSAETVKRPHIIAIMNESFADFRKLGNIQTDQEYLRYWDTLQENVIKGFVSVPIFGGWTANSEFEFLTGFSNAFFPSGTIPFQNYVKSGTPSINSHLKEQGYTSVFLHPMDSTGWNRKSVYQNLGFDYTYYLDDMEGADTLRGMVSDKGDYREVIEKFDENKEDGPVFIFNVTIQNHGGYGSNSLGNPVQILSPQGEYPQAEEYLTLIRESDKELENLLNHFSQEEEPVVICMFGDHYPKVEETLYEELAKTAQGNEAEKTSLQYQVPFMIYTNYDIEEKEYSNISLNYLSVLLCETAQIPLNDYQEYLEGLYQEYPVVNVYGVKNKDGEWMNWDEAAEMPEIQEYEAVQYRNLFEGN